MTTAGIKNNSILMVIKLFFIVATVILSGCSVTHAAENKAISLRPGEIHESCHDLATGIKLNYQYTGGSVTLFNIHYHKGKEIIYPVPDELAFRRNSSLTAASTQTYCLMWRNIQGRPVAVQYNVDFPTE
ncbi:MAG: hypothetical protein KAJ95_02545 [Gammaproteobacteria bacterium]|nr:hypothetical protein [Gammaproteobacteria bacterium]